MDNSTLEVHTYPTELNQESEFYVDLCYENGHSEGDINWMVVKNFKLINH
jgi:hypothetical protein